MMRNDISAALERRLQKEKGRPVAFPSYEKVLKRLATEKLTFYWGIDPTGDQLHIGHSIQLLLLKALSSFGHEIIILIGDFTARIGDPTDKSAARTVLTEQEVKDNYDSYLRQIEKLLAKKSFHVRYNSQWLKKMPLERVLDLTNRATVQQMLTRDMFQKRIADEKPVMISEFLYPLMQGYDSVAMEVDGETGGNDQTFNMLVGRDLVKYYNKKDKIVLPTQLLVDAKTGKKVSKSEGGFIALDDKPEIIFEKVSRSIPNEMIQTVFELCTELPIEEIQKKQKNAEQKDDWRNYNLDLAYELVLLYYDETTADTARAAYSQAVRGSTSSDNEAVRVKADEGTSIIKILSEALGVSKSEAKRLIEQKAVTRNGELVTDALGPAGASSGDVLRVGSHRPFRIILEK